MPDHDKSLIGKFLGHSAGILGVTWLLMLIVFEGRCGPSMYREQQFWAVPCVGFVVWILFLVRFSRRAERKCAVGIGVLLAVPVVAVTFVVVTVVALFTGIFELSMPHGRPLRRSRRRVRVRWSLERSEASIPRIPWRTRMRLAASWITDARREQESVTAFEVLAARLASVGVPEHLVGDARRFALQELGHAQACAAIASRHVGVRLQIDAATAAPIVARDEDLAELAVESLADGCLGEGHAAIAARNAAVDTTDAPTRAVLERIAIEEAEHAAHGWQVLEHCVATGGAPVRDRIATEIARLERDRPVTLLARSQANRTLVAYGRPAESRPGATFVAVRNDVIARARALLDVTSS